ncbi:hypothetical protein CAEBREN_02471 [Caenorhabditis brenneri]|uniref:Uncharacterized protein n=1 Tax=Caenorhabditis brenneri TaxID=135651 RepID=G0MI35_CAEBE|nr:hypothetical protein CAEBREN_02471 [Caenorhabditis brenneri]
MPRAAEYIRQPLQKLPDPKDYYYVDGIPVFTEEAIQKILDAKTPEQTILERFGLGALEVEKGIKDFHRVLAGRPLTEEMQINLNELDDQYYKARLYRASGALDNKVLENGLIIFKQYLLYLGCLCVQLEMDAQRGMNMR